MSVRISPSSTLAFVFAVVTFSHSVLADSGPPQARSASSDAAPDALIVDESDEVQSSDAAMFDADRWMFRLLAAVAAPVGSIVGVGVFLMIRAAFVGMLVVLPSAFGSSTARDVSALIYQASYISYAMLPIAAGLGAALFVLPFTSLIGSLATGAVTTGATAILGIVGTLAGAGLGAFLGGALGFYVGINDPFPYIGLLYLLVGGIVGGVIGAGVGALAALLGGTIVTPTVMGVVVGKKPDWWDENVSPAFTE
jgi:hypothetical protein